MRTRCPPAASGRRSKPPIRAEGTAAAARLLRAPASRAQAPWPGSASVPCGTTPLPGPQVPAHLRRTPPHPTRPARVSIGSTATDSHDTLSLDCLVPARWQRVKIVQPGPPPTRSRDPVVPHAHTHIRTHNTMLAQSEACPTCPLSGLSAARCALCAAAARCNVVLGWAQDSRGGGVCCGQ